MLKALSSRIDFILSTIPRKSMTCRPTRICSNATRRFVVAGALEPLASVDRSLLAFHRRRVAGSLIGSLSETQEILNFCAHHAITPDIEVIPIHDINKALAIENGGVRFRYVIDMASLKLEVA